MTAFASPSASESILAAIEDGCEPGKDCIIKTIFGPRNNEAKINQELAGAVLLYSTWKVRDRAWYDLGAKTIAASAHTIHINYYKFSSMAKSEYIVVTSTTGTSLKAFQLKLGEVMLAVLGFSPSSPAQNYHHPPALPTESLQPMNSLPLVLEPRLRALTSLTKY